MGLCDGGGLRSARSRELTQGVTVTQSREAAEVRIHGDELAAVFDGEGGMIGVCNELAAGAGCAAQLGEDIPAPWTVGERPGIGSTAQSPNKFQSVLEGCRLVPNPGVRHDANEAAGASSDSAKGSGPCAVLVSHSA